MIRTHLRKLKEGERRAGGGWQETKIDSTALEQLKIGTEKMKPRRFWSFGNCCDRSHFFSGSAVTAKEGKTVLP